MMYIMNHKGWMEVICGSMFSGKSEELIRRVKRATYGNQKIRVFKPAIDNRYKDDRSSLITETRSSPTRSDKLQKLKKM